MADPAMVSAFAERERVVEEVITDKQLLTQCSLMLKACDQALSSVKSDKVNAKIWVNIDGLFIKVNKTKAVDILNAQRRHHENVMMETQHQLQSKITLLQQLETDRQNKFRGYMLQDDDVNA